MELDHNRKYHITSTANETIRKDLRLQNRRFRNSCGLLSIEGYGECKMARKAGVCIERLYICPDYLRPEEANFLHTFDGQVPIYISPQIMRKLAYRQHPDAWFAILKWDPLPLQKLTPKPGGTGVYIIAEGLEKPGNLGAILRSADAAGVDAVIVSEGKTDLRNPNVVRASKGSLFSVPCVEANNQQILHWLREHNISITIADPERSDNLWTADLPLPLALVLGTENEGLSTFWKEAAHMVLSIPMLGNMNSLNVAQAATVIMYEILRRHRFP